MSCLFTFLRLLWCQNFKLRWTPPEFCCCPCIWSLSFLYFQVIAKILTLFLGSINSFHFFSHVFYKCELLLKSFLHALKFFFRTLPLPFCYHLRSFEIINSEMNFWWCSILLSCFLYLKSHFLSLYWSSEKVVKSVLLKPTAYT